MSERIYVWLLRLYPAHFRKTCGEDALQLFRDRSRDEKGFFPGLRLWLDLFADLAVSIPREYGHEQPATIGAAVQPRLDGPPTFQVLGGELPRPGALLSAVLLVLVAAGSISALSGLQSKMPMSPGGLGWSQSQAPQGKENMKLDAAGRRLIIDGAIANLKRYYDYPEAGQKIANALLAHEKSGDDNAVTDGEAFADLLNRQMAEVSHDRNLMVVYNRVKVPVRPDRPTAPSAEAQARYRKALEQNNCFFEKVEIRAHNIGYLKLNSFPDPSICQPTAAAAMASLNDADAIIFDLRDNTGGYPKMVALIASYLFDKPTHLNDMYDRGENTTQQSWTPVPVPGNRLADKPAYVLTSGVTFSGAEEFSYDLQMLKRATIVGEATSGRGHIPIARRIDDHFEIRVPDRRSINPISKTDWDGPGVVPDIKVKAADALETAEKLAGN